MRDGRPSSTAAWVAIMRGLGTFLPDSLRLADDPYGFRFAGPLGVLGGRAAAVGLRVASAAWLRGSLRAAVLFIQLRTRVIDDDVVAFARSGGRQVVLMGAGFDCRAWRLGALDGVTVFEVDHPATQTRKRAVMEGTPTPARVVFVPWDFERNRLDERSARLRLDGHDASIPTMTVLEGVLMYLSEAAAIATFETVAGYSSAGSTIAFNYMDRALLDDRSRETVRERRLVRLVGEPFRFGLDPATLPAWLAARRFTLQRDESMPEAAGRLVGERAARMMAKPIHARRRLARASRVG